MLNKIKKTQKIKLLYGGLQKASILIHKIFINIKFDLKKNTYWKIWRDFVKKLKEEVQRNHQFRAIKFVD
jgi:hypothetical protein